MQAYCIDRQGARDAVARFAAQIAAQVVTGSDRETRQLLGPNSDTFEGWALLLSDRIALDSYGVLHKYEALPFRVWSEAPVDPQDLPFGEVRHLLFALAHAAIERDLTLH